MKKINFLSFLTRTIILSSLSLVSGACAPTTYVFIETNSPTSPPPPSTQTPIETVFPFPSPPLPEEVEILDVTWSIIPKCIDGILKQANIKLIVSGGNQPFDISPSREFSLSAGQIKEITVKSGDKQTWVGKIKAPESCGEASSGKVVITGTESFPTKAPATDPPPTQPPATDLPATKPPATDPPVIDPPATEPPNCDPPGQGGVPPGQGGNPPGQCPP